MSIGDLATILTVAGVSIYVLGLIGLAIPIRREFTGDISTAWYAVSLVPKTVVAGQGARLWLRWPAVFAALLLVMTVVLRVLLPSLPTDPDLTFRVALLATVLLIVVPRMPSLARNIIRTTTKIFPTVVLLVAMWSMVWTVGVMWITISWSMLAYPEGVAILFKGLPIKDWQDWPILHSSFPPAGNPPLLRGVIVLLIGSFILGIPPALQASPPLPKVRITKQPEDTIEGVADPLEGWLVAHNDGFWHLFPRLPTDENEKHYEFIHRDLISILDDKAVVVRTFGKEVAPAKGPSEEDGQRDAEEARLETEQGGESVDVSPPERPAPE